MVIIKFKTSFKFSHHSFLSELPLQLLSQQATGEKKKPNFSRKDFQTKADNSRLENISGKALNAT